MASHEFVGRETELAIIEKAFDSALAGKGSTTIISGEPGIGKSRLVEHCRSNAAAKGMKILAGGASQDSQEPFHVFTKALSEYTREPLMAMTKSVSFSGVFIASATGEIMAKAMLGGMDPEKIASTLSAVQSFVGDSFMNAEGRIGRMTFGDLTVLAERCGDALLFGIVEGEEHPEMATSLKVLAADIAKAGHTYEEAISKAAELKFSVRRDLSGVKLSSERNRLADRTLEIIAHATGDQPVLIVFEDMHWSDETSLFVFSYLVRVAPRLRLSILATARSSETPLWDRELESLVSEGSTAIIPLVQMDEAIIRKLVNSLYSPNNFPDDFYSKLTRDCAGNPLFTEELVNQMAVEGGIALKGSCFTLTESHYSVPNRIEDLVQKRLESLVPATLAAAEQLACAGREFPANLPRALKNIRDHESALTDLSTAGIVVAAGQTLQFKHALFRDAIYKNISGRWLANYHRELGEYYEAEYAEKPGTVIYELARHFHKSNEKDKAFEYCFRAGESAEASYAAEQAIEFYHWALVTMPLCKKKSACERGAELHECIGNMQTLISRFPEAISSYTDAISITSQNLHKAQLHRKICEAQWKLGNYDASLEEIAKGEALTDDMLELINLGHQRAYILMRRGDYDSAIKICTGLLVQLKTMKAPEKVVASLYDTLASSHHRKGDHALALEYYNKCLVTSESLGDLRKMGAVLNNIGNVYGDRLQNEQSRQYYDRSLAIFKKIGDKQAVGVIIGNIGAIHHSTGSVSKALECYTRGLAIAEETGDLRMISASLGNMGVTQFTLGNFGLCIETFGRAMRIWEMMGDQASMAWGNSSIGAAYNEMGDSDKARECLLLGIESSESSDDQWKLCAAHLFMGDLLKNMGESESPAESYGKSRDIAAQLDSPDLLAESYTGLAETALLVGNNARAEENIASAIKTSTDANLRVELANALRASALLLASKGNSEEADAEFRKSMAIYNIIENPVAKAKLLYDWGRSALSWGKAEEGREMVKAALGTFIRSEMAVWIERCNRLLGAGPRIPIRP